MIYTYIYIYIHIHTCIYIYIYIYIYREREIYIHIITITMITMIPRITPCRAPLQITSAFAARAEWTPDIGGWPASGRPSSRNWSRASSSRHQPSPRNQVRADARSMVPACSVSSIEKTARPSGSKGDSSAASPPVQLPMELSPCAAPSTRQSFA